MALYEITVESVPADEDHPLYVYEQTLCEGRKPRDPAKTPLEVIQWATSWARTLSVARTKVTIAGYRPRQVFAGRTVEGPVSMFLTDFEVTPYEVNPPAVETGP